MLPEGIASMLVFSIVLEMYILDMKVVAHVFVGPALSTVLYAVVGEGGDDRFKPRGFQIPTICHQKPIHPKE